MKIICKSTLLSAEPEYEGTLVGVDMPADDLEMCIRNITIPQGTPKAVIDWGDGETTERTRDMAGVIYHTYPKAGRYYIRITDAVSDMFISFRISSVYDRYALRVVSFKSKAQLLTHLKGYCFNGCMNLKEFDIASAAISHINTDCFKNCHALTEIRLPFVSNIDTDAGADAHPFAGCENLRMIHFAAANKEAILASASYAADHTLGSGAAELSFDL